MDAAAELGRNPVSKQQIQPEYGDEQVDAGRDGRTHLARPHSQARTRTGEYYFLCSADHEQDWHPYPVDPYSCYMCDHTLLPTYEERWEHSSSELDVSLITVYSNNSIVFETCLTPSYYRIYHRINPRMNLAAVFREISLVHNTKKTETNLSM